MVKFIIIFILLQISFQEDITLKDNEPYEKEFKNPDYDIIFSTTAINITKPYIQIKTKAISNQALIYVNSGDSEPDFSNHDYASIQFINNLFYVPKSVIEDNKFTIKVICLGKCNFQIYIKTIDKIEINTNEIITLFSTEKLYDITINGGNPKSIISITAISGAKKEISLTLKTKIKEIEKEITFEDGLTGKGVVINQNDFSSESNIIYEGKLVSIPNCYIVISVSDISNIQKISPYVNSIYGHLNQNDLLKNGICYEIEINENSKNFRVSAISDKNIYISMSKNIGSDIGKNIQFKSYYHNYFDFDKEYFKEGYKYICVKGEKNENISYIMQITDITNLDIGNFNVDPLLNGFIYKDELKPNQIRQYRKMKYASKTTQETKYNVRVISGDIKVYIYLCDKFPYCNNTISELKELEQNLIVPYSINNFYSAGIMQLTKEKYSKGKQYLLYVICNENNKNSCNYEISFFDEDDSLLLREDFKVSEFIKFGNIFYQYHFNIEDDKVKEVLVSLYTISGDINFTVISNEKIQEKIQIGNVNIIKFTNENQKLNGIYNINITGYKNSFYYLSYQIITDDIKTEKEDVGLGITLIKSIKPNQNKIFKFTHNINNLNNNFVSQFFPINCKINVEYKNKILTSTNSLFQHELTKSDLDFSDREIEYKIIFDSMDESETYDNKLCFFYISSQEISNNNQVLINDLLPFDFKLNTKVPKIKLLYPYTSNEKEVFIGINLPTQFTIASRIFIENKVIIEEIEFSKYKSFIIDTNTLSSNCKNKYECNILIEIYSKSEEDLKKEIKLKISIDPRTKTPSYLKKSTLRKDYINVEAINYYMTEIAENEEGEILINFERGGGIMFAKIVQKTENEINPDWNGRINLPKENSTNLLKYDSFTKKIYYFKNNTSKCKKGCDLFLGVITKDTYKEEIQSMFYSKYTLYLRHLNKKNNEGTIEIPVNEYIYGSIEKTISNNYFDYYQITIPHSTDKITFEFQTQICSMYISLGNNFPNLNEYDWNFFGENTLNIIKKGDMSRQGKIIPDDLKGLNFTIAVGTSDLDDIYTAVYSFNVRANLLKMLNIIDVNSDQNTICKIRNDSDYCDFLLYFNSFETYENLFIYVLNTGVSNIEIYGKKIEIQKFDKMNKSEIEKQLPRKNSIDLKYNSTKQFNKNYLFIDFSDISQNEYLLISVFSPKITTITLINTLRTFVKTTIPNPNYLQLFSITPNNPISLEIDKTNIYLFNIYSIDGTGKIGFDNKDYYDLYGTRDSIILLSDKKQNYLNITSKENLKVMFWNYITPEKRHLTEIEFGSSYKIINTNNDFPIHLYTKIEDKNSDINLNLYFKKIKLKNNNTQFKKIDNIFLLNGYIIDEKMFIKMKKDHSVHPGEEEKIEGKYDSSIQKAKIYIKSSDIKKKEKEVLYVYFNLLSKGSEKYEECEIEVSNLPFSNSTSPINQYVDGSFLLGQEKPNIHYLKKEKKNDKKMRIEFSTSSKEINFAFIKDINKVNKTENDTINFISQENQNGKSIFYINSSDIDGIYLSVFPKEKKIQKEISSNYVFKYNSYKNESIIINDILADDDGKLKYEYNLNKNELKLTIPSLIEKKTKKKILAQYFIRIFKKETLSNMTKLDTISFITEEPFESYQFTSKNEMTININNINSNQNYSISCIGKTEDGELISYKSFETNNTIPQPKPSDQGNNNFILIIILIVIILILITVFIFVFIKMKKDKDFLLQKINNLSQIDNGHEKLIPNYTENAI